MGIQGIKTRCCYLQFSYWRSLQSGENSTCSRSDSIDESLWVTSRHSNIYCFTRRSIQDIEQNTLLIGATIKDGDLESAKYLIRQFASKGLHPNVRTYTIVIEGLLRRGLAGDAEHLFRQMAENGYPPNSCTYSIMIRGCARNYELSRAVQLSKEMVGKGFSAMLQLWSCLLI